MSPSYYWYYQVGKTTMAALAILPALTRMGYSEIHLVPVPKSHGECIVTINKPIEPEFQEAAGLHPLEDP